MSSITTGGGSKKTAKKAKRIPKIEEVEATLEAGVTITVIAESIVAIAEGAKKLTNSGLNQRAILVLLKDATGVPMTDIKKVLHGLESLEEKYCK